MPRTKYHRSSKDRTKFSKSTSMDTSETPSEFDNKNIVKIWLFNLETEYSTILSKLRSVEAMFNDELEKLAFIKFSLIEPRIKNKTLGELRKEKSMSVTSVSTVTCDVASILKSFNGTVNTLSKKNKTKKTTGDDEGYLTATDSKRSASGDRASRARNKSNNNNRSKRVSKSLSRSRAPKSVTIQAPQKQTPDRKIPPLTFGMVTPKVKPNMPVSVFRRPKQGEMAISMQGSPLLVSGVITETCANVNIPMIDGRLLSLQPCNTLRPSEIPELDDETRRQLVTLRDNLNKLVYVTKED